MFWTDFVQDNMIYKNEPQINQDYSILKHIALY